MDAGEHNGTNGTALQQQQASGHESNNNATTTMDDNNNHHNHIANILFANFVACWDFIEDKFGGDEEKQKFNNWDIWKFRRHYQASREFKINIKRRTVAPEMVARHEDALRNICRILMGMLNMDKVEQIMQTMSELKGKAMDRWNVPKRN